MNVGPWAVSFSALVPLHESHSESGLLMNYRCAPAVTRQYPDIPQPLPVSTLINYRYTTAVTYQYPNEL